MANTTNMIRLMTHAADLLDACDPAGNGKRIVEMTHRDDVRVAALRSATQETAAIAHASAILRMVAAAMDDDPEPSAAPSTPEEQP